MAGTPKASLTTTRRKRDARHLFRWMQSQLGKTVEEIAAAENVAPATIEASIQSLMLYQEQNTQLRAELAFRDLIIEAIPQAKEAMGGLLQATTIVGVKDKTTGTIVDTEVPDKITRIEALRLLGNMFTATQPKTPGVAVQVNNNQQNNSPTVGRGETNEERLRRIRAEQAKYNLLPPKVIGVPQNIDEGYDPDDPENASEDFDDAEED